MEWGCLLKSISWWKCLFLLTSQAKTITHCVIITIMATKAPMQLSHCHSNEGNDTTLLQHSQSRGIWFTWFSKVWSTHHHHFWIHYWTSHKSLLIPLVSLALMYFCSYHTCIHFCQQQYVDWQRNKFKDKRNQLYWVLTRTVLSWRTLHFLLFSIRFSFVLHCFLISLRPFPCFSDCRAEQCPSSWRGGDMRPGGVTGPWVRRMGSGQGCATEPYGRMQTGTLLHA